MLFQYFCVLSLILVNALVAGDTSQETTAQSIPTPVNPTPSAPVLGNPAPVNPAAIPEQPAAQIETPPPAMHVPANPQPMLQPQPGLPVDTPAPVNPAAAPGQPAHHDAATHSAVNELPAESEPMPKPPHDMTPMAPEQAPAEGGAHDQGPAADEKNKNLSAELDDELTFGLSPDDNRGNWLEKRKIARQAEQLYEQVRAKILKIQQFEQPALKKRTQAESLFEGFIVSAGISQHDLAQLVDDLIAKLQAERSEEVQLSEEERALLQKITEHKEPLENIKKQLDTIGTIDKKIGEAFATVLEQVKVSTDIEQKVWECVENIHKIADHLKAEQLLAQIKAYAGTLDDTTSYLETKLLPYMDSTATSMQTSMNTITQTLKKLDTEGLSLKKEVTEKTKKAPEHKQAPVQSQKSTSLGWRDYIYAGWEQIKEKFLYIYTWTKTTLKI